MAGNSILLRIRPGDRSRYSLEITSPTDYVYGPYSIEVTREAHSARNQSLRAELNTVLRRLSEHTGTQLLVLTESQQEVILRVFAREGKAAFDEVFPKENGNARSCITDLLHDPKVDTIKICAEDFSLPWELLCPSSPRGIEDDGASRPEMWGERYVIQRSFPLNRPKDGQRLSEMWVSRPRVALASCIELRYVQDEIAYLDRLHKNDVIHLSRLRGLNPGIERREKEMLEVQRFFGMKSDIAHFACHVETAEDSDRSSLVISHGFRLRPHDIKSYGVRFEGNPLVVLNACDTGTRHPLQTAGFVSSILKCSESIGIVATVCEVPSRFAAAFAQRFYDKFLLSNPGLPIGQALLETRQEFMKSRYYNPLGLLYSLYQVNPELRLVKGTL